MTRFRQAIADLRKASTPVGLPPPLRGRVGEGVGRESYARIGPQASLAALLISNRSKDWSLMCP
jgi:hypothetical protein